MNRIFVTGDKHGDVDLKVLGNRHFPAGKKLSKYDYIIILGDWGCIWDIIETKWERNILAYYNAKKYTTLVIDGNHENHARLDALETTSLLGGKVGIISDSIFHLKRGEIYTIGGKTLFVFGGAASYDKHLRKENVSWWARELPSHEEEDNALNNLEKAQHQVDYILAHTLPQFVAEEEFTGKNTRLQDMDPTRKFLEHVVENNKFKEYYCGHWHTNMHFMKREKHYNILYGNVVELI